VGIFEGGAGGGEHLFLLIGSDGHGHGAFLFLFWKIIGTQGPSTSLASLRFGRDGMSF
jgi:hypothetical protein